MSTLATPTDRRLLDYLAACRNRADTLAERHEAVARALAALAVELHGDGCARETQRAQYHEMRAGQETAERNRLDALRSAILDTPLDSDAYCLALARACQYLRGSVDRADLSRDLRRFGVDEDLAEHAATLADDAGDFLP